MRKPALVFFFAALAGLAACGPADPSPNVPRAQVAKAGAVDPLALAREIDPGPIDPVGPALPEGMRHELDASDVAKFPPKDKIARAEAARNRMFRAFGPTNQLTMDDQWLAPLIENIYFLEPIAFANPPTGDSAAAADLLRFSYGFMRSFATARDFLPEILLATNKAAVDRAGLGHFYSLVAANEEKLDRAMIAIILRAGQGRVLWDGMSSMAGFLEDKDPARSMAIRQDELSRRGTLASAFDWNGLAVTCYRQTDVACGDAALARAKSLETQPDDQYGAATPQLLANELRKTEDYARAAKIIASLQNKTNPEDRLARARAEMDLGQQERAIADLTSLAQATPDDARPLVMLARATVAKTGATEASIRAAAGILDRAATRNHKDGEFYDARIAFTGQLLLFGFATLVSQTKESDRPALMGHVNELRGFTTELAQWEPDRAAVIQLLIDLFMKLSENNDNAYEADTAIAMLPRVREMRQKYPDSLEVAELARAFGSIDSTRDALTSLDFPWPKSEDEESRGANLLVLRTALATRWDAPERVPTTTEIADMIVREPTEAGILRILQGDAIAARGFINGDKTAWVPAARAYEAAISNAPQKHAVRALVNLGTAYAESGRVDEARQIWKRVAELQGQADTELAGLNLAAINVGVVSPEDSEIAFAKIAEATTAGQKQNLQARAWLVFLAKKRGDLETAKKIAKDMVPDRRKGSFPSRKEAFKVIVPIEDNQFAFLIHFTPTHKELYHLDLSMSPYIAWVLRAPMTEEDLDALGGVKPDAVGSKDPKSGAKKN